jgi:DNA-directed RNA polymerase specialized sigma24 family protein
MPALATDIELTSSLEAEQVARAFAAPRSEYHGILELSLFRGLTQSEIASHLQMPLGIVESFMRRGLTQVRDLMNIQSPPKGVPEDPAPHRDRLRMDVAETFTAALG